MNNPTIFQIQIKTHNYEGGSPTITKEISLSDLCRFSNLVSYININSGNRVWNWFGKGLPDKWDGEKYVLDTWKISHHMNENFGFKVTDIELIKEFFHRFTPNGCDGIEYVKFFKVEELTETFIS